MTNRKGRYNAVVRARGEASYLRLSGVDRNTIHHHHPSSLSPCLNVLLRGSLSVLYNCPYSFSVSSPSSSSSLSSSSLAPFVTWIVPESTISVRLPVLFRSHPQIAKNYQTVAGLLLLDLNLLTSAYSHDSISENMVLCTILSYNFLLP